MVFAFLIQTLNQTSYDILYYRFYSCYNSKGAVSSSHKVVFDKESSNSEGDSLKSVTRAAKLFETSDEKEEFLQLISGKINMHYCQKLQHSLLPLADKDISSRGVFMERSWKENAFQIPVVWQSVHSLGFALVCKKGENLLQAQNVLDIIISQLDKHLQFISNPVASLTVIETVSLIVNQYIPSGELIFMNSALRKAYEKTLETDLYAR